MADVPQGIGYAGHMIFVPRGKGQPDTGNLDRIKNCGEPVGKHLKVNLRRCDEVDLRALGVGHAWLHVFKWPLLSQKSGLGYVGGSVAAKACIARFKHHHQNPGAERPACSDLVSPGHPRRLVSLTGERYQTQSIDPLPKGPR
jgi:hypothetical protein